LVVAIVVEKLAVSKRAAQKVDIDRLNLRKINDEEVKNSTMLQPETILQLWET
jgi:hypothetical protein